MQGGRFLTLEGTEGVGKSTQLRRVASWLQAVGITATTTREPGGTPTAEEIRKVLLATEQGDPLPDIAELLLMFAARATHTRNLIEPTLARGDWVLCDRYTDATIAYQGGGRGLSESRIATLAQWVHGDLQPDCTVLLDAPVEIGMARARGRDDAPDRFEREDLAFFQRVRERYLRLAQAEPGRFIVIDAAGDTETVGRHVCEALAARYALPLTEASGPGAGA